MLFIIKLFTPIIAPELIIGKLSKIKSRLTYDSPVYEFFLTEFFQIEAIDPPIKNIYVKEMLSFEL